MSDEWPKDFVDALVYNLALTWDEDEYRCIQIALGLVEEEKT